MVAEALGDGVVQLGLVLLHREQVVRSAVPAVPADLSLAEDSVDQLRLTAAWADGIGIAGLSNVALFGRLRTMLLWLERIAAHRLVTAAPSARDHGRLWRIHATFELTDETGAEHKKRETGQPAGRTGHEPELRLAGIRMQVCAAGFIPAAAIPFRLCPSRRTGARARAGRSGRRRSRS